MKRILFAIVVCLAISTALFLNAVSSEDQPSPQPATQPAISWGKAVNGLQSGLRFGLQARVYRMGELVDFVLLVRNTGGRTVTLVDYIPLTGRAPTVRTVDGKLLPIAVPTIGMPVQVRKSVLKPGDILEVGTVFLLLDARPEERGQTPHAHLMPGKYLVSQFYRFADNQEATWFGQLTTGELTLSVAAADKPSEIGVPATQPNKKWGEPVEGVQVRLRADKKVWKLGETPTFKADVRNYGSREMLVHRSQMACELNFDGQWYEHKEIVGFISPFGPSKHYTDIHISLYDRWQTLRDDGGLNLVPGKHTVQVAFLPEPKGRGKPVIRAVSNPVEIRIQPAGQAGAKEAR